MKRTAMNFIASLCLVASPYAVGDDAHHKKDAGLTAGVVKKIDKAQGKVTISHEAIKNLRMPKMTMVFRVDKPAMLDEVKPGDKVRFVANKVDGNLTIVRWETVK